MSLETILNKQTDFTGEFPAEYAKGGLWRFNKDAPTGEYYLADSSGNGRDAYINKWTGTIASLVDGVFGSYFRMNINNPSSEQTYLKVANDGTIFFDLGERIIVGGWMRPTTYSVDNTYTPILSTRGGTGNPIFYLSLIRGKPRMMLYNSSGSLILDTSVTPPFSLENAKWYFIAAVIEPTNKKAWYVVGDKTAGTVWKSSALTFSVRKEGRTFEAEYPETAMAYALSGTEWAGLQGEMNEVAEQIEKCIAENARVAQNQDDYRKRYDTLAKRFDRTKARLEEVEQAIAEKQAHRELVEQFLSELAGQDAVTEYTDELWYSMIDFVTVYSKDDVRFTFKNGTEIKM